MEGGMKKITVVSSVVLTACAVVALATPAWQGVFNKTYTPKSGSALAKARCSSCHAKGSTASLNVYGKQLKGKPVTAASLKGIEKLDSDKDKACNIKEIKAGTLPGDSKSKPKI